MKRLARPEAWGVVLFVWFWFALNDQRVMDDWLLAVGAAAGVLSGRRRV